MSEKTNWKPSASQRQTLIALKAEADQEKSHAAFADKYTEISASKLSKIFAVLDDRDSYFDDVQNPDAEMDRLVIVLSNVQLRRAREAEMADTPLLDISAHRAVIAAIKQCRKKSTCERLVVFRAPTGGGKSILCSRLEREMNARVVHTRRQWKTSYTCALGDIAKAIGLNLGGECRPDVIEDKIIAHCRINPVLLAIDEGEYFGPDALNALKLLLNKTQITILICVIPEAHDRWTSKYGMESQQLERRQHAWVEQKEVSTADARLFFPDNQFEDEAEALKAVCEGAKFFGHFSFIQSVVEKLTGQKRADKQEVIAAISAAHRRMRK